MMSINRLPGLFALATFLLIGASFLLRTPGLLFNDELLIISFYFAAAYWLLTLIMVASTRRLNRDKKRFWLIALIFLPFLGGIVFQLTHTGSKKNVRKAKHAFANDGNTFIAEPMHKSNFSG